MILNEIFLVKLYKSIYGSDMPRKYRAKTDKKCQQKIIETDKETRLPFSKSNPYVPLFISFRTTKIRFLHASLI